MIDLNDYSRLKIKVYNGSPLVAQRAGGDKATAGVKAKRKREEKARQRAAKKSKKHR